jgi:hypothetical protein
VPWCPASGVTQAVQLSHRESDSVMRGSRGAETSAKASRDLDREGLSGCTFAADGVVPYPQLLSTEF